MWSEDAREKRCAELKAKNEEVEVEHRQGCLILQRVRERHYTVKEVAEMWNVSHDTARKMFLNEPDVLDCSEKPRPNGTKMRKTQKRPHRTILIPESVLIRVYKSRLNRVGAA